MTTGRIICERLEGLASLIEARGQIDRLERHVMAGDLESLQPYLRSARREGRPVSDVAPVVLDMIEKLDASGKRRLMGLVFNPDFVWSIRDRGSPRSADMVGKVLRARWTILQKIGEAIQKQLESSELKKHKLHSRVLLPGFYSSQSAALIEMPFTKAGSIKLSVEDNSDGPPFLWLFVNTMPYSRKAILTRMSNLGFPKPRVKRNPYELTAGGTDIALDVKTDLEGTTLRDMQQSAVSKMGHVRQLQSFLEFLKAPQRRRR